MISKQKEEEIKMRRKMTTEKPNERDGNTEIITRKDKR
jgi:hypothetical protein